MKYLENKIPPPVVGLIMGAGMWYLSTMTPAVIYSDMIRISLTIFFILVGVFFDLAGVVSFRMAKTTVNPLKPDKASSLVTSGIYQVTRNPMYVGFVAFLLALACYLGTAFGVVFIILYIMYIQRFQITPEERALTKLFKSEFSDYKAKVRPWL